MLGVAISIAVMFTKEGDIFLRAGLLLLIGVVFWLLNYAAMRGRDRFSTEELAQVQVVTVSRRPQNAMEAAAAVGLVSGEDIRRTGASTRFATPPAPSSRCP